MEPDYTVITGASSGIGREAALAFAARGHSLILTARRCFLLEKLRTEILDAHPELQVRIVYADLARPGEASAFYEKLRDFPVRTWINNAGIGDYGPVGSEDMDKTVRMLQLNVVSLTILSALFVRDCRDVPHAQLINIASCGGYVLVPDAVTYCAAKFYVTSYTEGLARELQAAGAEMTAKVLAPAATATEFGMHANDTVCYDYDAAFGRYHTARQVAQFLLALYDSSRTVGLVDRETFSFDLMDPQFPSAHSSSHNQKPAAGISV